MSSEQLLVDAIKIITLFYAYLAACGVALWGIIQVYKWMVGE